MANEPRNHSNLMAAAIERGLHRNGSVTFVSAAETHTTSWGALAENAHRLAAALPDAGIMPGDCVALFGPTTQDLVTSLLALWLLGATATILAPPERAIGLDSYISTQRERLDYAGAAFLLVDPMFSETFDISAFGVRWAPMPVSAAAAIEQSFVPAASGKFLQFTSGSTGRPKAVSLSADQIVANVDGMSAAAELDPTQDRFLSWLPLYHDMGLIGFLCWPMITGTDLVLLDTQEFVASPMSWMSLASSYRATLTGAPNFAYGLAARRGPTAGMDLSSMRLLFNGAEPVDGAVADRFLSTFESSGLARGAMYPVYGLAEATLAVTFPKPGSGLRTDVVDAGRLDNDRVAEGPVANARVRQLARLGEPIPNIELRVADPQTGEELPDRAAGEVEVRGPSVTRGYYQRADLNQELLRDGWLRTGDLAYKTDRDLVVCGRLKDVVLVNGRNYAAEDFERAVQSVAGVRPGNVAAFGATLGGRERLVLAAEVLEETSSIEPTIAEAVSRATGVVPYEVLLLPPRTMPKTSSGKLQRGLCRDMYLAGRLQS